MQPAVRQIEHRAGASSRRARRGWMPRQRCWTQRCWFMLRCAALRCPVLRCARWGSLDRPLVGAASQEFLNVPPLGQGRLDAAPQAVAPRAAEAQHHLQQQQRGQATGAGG